MTSWIEEQGPGEGPPELERLYRQLVHPGHGDVDHILRVQSLDPPALRAHLQLYRATMQGSDSLTRAEREMIAVVVSRANDCFY